jgi:cell filamentation protein
VKDKGRYDVSRSVEAQYEPCSRHRVLRNLTGIRRKREMDRAEAEAHIRALRGMFSAYTPDHRFTAADIREMHRTWLGSIYPWAGEYRSVNMTKEDFTFAAAHVIPSLMEEFEKGPLKLYTPCRFKEKEEAAYAMAVVHTELLLIHPFREGNGRLARMLAILMALQNDLPPLNYGLIKGRNRQEYFRAVRAGLTRDYEPMSKLFRVTIARTLRLSVDR